MQMLVMAHSGQPQNNDVPQAPQVSHTHFRGFASPTSYGNHSNWTPVTRSFVPSQFNRIGSEVMQSISGQEPILGSYSDTNRRWKVFSCDDYITVLYLT